MDTISERLRIQLDSRLTDGDEVVSLTRQPRFDPQKHFLIHSATRVQLRSYLKKKEPRLEIREYVRKDPSRWPRGISYSQKEVGTNFADKRRVLFASGLKPRSLV
jgi:hypothetical protein